MTAAARRPPRNPLLLRSSYHAASRLVPLVKDRRTGA